MCRNPKCQPKDKGRFISEEPVCPQCKISAADPKYGSLILRATMIHYDPPIMEMPGFFQNVRACDKSKIITLGSAGTRKCPPSHGGSGRVQSVTCPDCMETAEYKAAVARCQNEVFKSQVKDAAAQRTQEFVLQSLNR